MRAALNIVFPKALILGDSFHFYHDNRKWMNANSGADYTNELDAHLHVLLESPTYDTYVENEGM